MSLPRVSVLLTTRDGAAWIGHSLDSIFAQSLADFELVVVDDASTDATPAILAAIGDPRLRVIRNTAPHGIAGARNVGLAACRAPYVAVLDHDDISLPGRLLAQAGYLDRTPDCVMVGTAVGILRDGVTSASGQPARIDPDGLRLALHLGNPLTWSSMMFRRAALDRLAPDGEVMRRAAEPADDFDLYHRLLAHGAPARLDAVLTLYRWHAGNTTHRMAGQIADRAAAVLAGAYAPWFGDAASAAARLAIAHVSDKVPAGDAATLDRVLALIGQVAAHVPGGAAARQLQWDVLRRAVRSGAPGLIVGRGRYVPLRVDSLVSVALGLARKQGLLF